MGGTSFDDRFDYAETKGKHKTTIEFSNIKFCAYNVNLKVEMKNKIIYDLSMAKVIFHFIRNH